MEAGTIQPLMEALVQVKPAPVAIAEITVYSLSFLKIHPMAAAQAQVVSGGDLSAMRPPVTAIVETAPMVTMQTLAMLAIIINP